MLSESWVTGHLVARGPENMKEQEMSEHVIVGAGAVGSAAALLLAERGEHVRIVSRRGSGPSTRRSSGSPRMRPMPSG